ncbi:MAG: patatin [Cytophagaceae bacterium]|nr:patatin [Cytophagaceae bacterium]
MSLGLALSGGGIKGVAHIAAIKAIEEHGLHPTHIAGTSAGAIIGALYAQGVSWQDMLQFVKEIAVFSIKRYARNKPGFIDSRSFYKDFLPILPHDSFEGLRIPLKITATELIKGHSTVFDSGALIMPLLASASFPGVFTPVSIGGVHYFDGGVINDFPVHLLASSCEDIIGVYTNPLPAIDIGDIKHSFQVLSRAYDINVSHRAVDKFDLCDILICPEELSAYGTFSMKSIQQIFDIGYKAAYTELAHLKK